MEQRKKIRTGYGAEEEDKDGIWSRGGRYEK
jgi:hypothetical protein